MADIAELGYRVDSSQLDRATRELDRNADAAGRATTASSKLEKQAKQLGRVLGVAIVAGATAAAIAIQRMINQADKLRDLSIRIGVGTENLSAWGFAAEQTGTNLDALSGGLKILSKNVADAQKATSEQAKIFNAMGIEVVDTEGKLKNLGVLVPQIATAFKSMEDGTTKTALALALFGRSGQELIEFLNQGADGLDEFYRRAEELGILIDTETANAADEFNDTLGELKAVVSGGALTIAKELLPALQDAAEDLTRLAKEGEFASNAADVLSAALKVGVGILDAYNAAVRYTEIALEALVPLMVGVSEAARNIGPQGLFVDGSVAGGIQKVAEGYKNAKGEMVSYWEEQDARAKKANGMFSDVSGRVLSGASNVNQKALQRALAGADPKAKKSGKSDEVRDAERLEEGYKRLIAQLKEQAAMVGVVTEVEKLRYDLNNGEMAKLSQGQKDELLNLAQILDFRREDQENLEEAIKAEEERLRVIDEATKAYEETNQSILDQITLLGMTAAEQEIWNNLAWAGVTAESARGQEIIKNTKLLQETRQAMEEQIEIMDTVRDAGKGLIVDLGNGVKPIDAIADAWERVRQKLLEMAAENLMDMVFGKQGDAAGGSTGGWLSSLFGGGGGAGSAGGSSSTGGGWGELFGAIFGGGRANGGDVRGDSMYQVGERNRPELLNLGGKQFLIPGDQGNVEPIRNTRRDRKSGNTIINIGVEGKVTRQTRGQIGGDVARSVRESSRNN